MWVVLVGPHCAGKTTVGRALAAKMGWKFDGEIGDELMQRDNPLKGQGDDEILRQELQRDTIRSGICRVVETWHFGNAAWATYRERTDLVESMLDSAIKAKESEPLILCFALKCNDEDRRRRWVGLGTQQVTMGTEVETLEKTDTIGEDAEAMARSILQQHVRTIWSTNDQTVAEVVDRIQCELLDLVVPGPSPIFQSLQAARDALYLASQVIPELHKKLPRSCMDVALPCADSLCYPHVVIVVEGLDGSGKTTLVDRLQQHLGSNAIQMGSPPAVLTNARGWFEKDWKNCSDAEYNLRTSKAFHRLKRAFFTFGNYVLATELAGGSICSPVIVDRFASSTLAYTWGSLDAETSRVACFVRSVLDFVFPFHKRAIWPNDLPKPNLVLILEADEQVRKRRIQSRSQGTGFGVGEWEKAFERNSRLGTAISYHLKNIRGGPPTAIIDANTEDRNQVFRRAASKLMDHGIAVVFRQVVDVETSEALLGDWSQAGQNELPQQQLNRHKWDFTNKLYSSRRHRNVEVCFLQTDQVTSLTGTICRRLSEATGRDGWAVQDDILPVFRYQDGGEILPHRDVHLMPNLRDYCAVLMLSRPGYDFSSQSGALYVNASATVHGNSSGQVKNEIQTRRQYFADLQQGDVVVFRNSLCIHGVDRVTIPGTAKDNDGKSMPTQRGRITASFRI